jgi:hypothetical protein
MSGMIRSSLVSSKLSAAQWEQIKTAYASGIGLRELARNMGVSENTVLARARREKWTQQIVTAKQHAKPLHSNALTPMHSAAITMQERAQRYTERMAGVSEKVLPHLESMQPGAILDSARNIEQYDRMSRRNYGLDSQPAGAGLINVAIMTNRAAIQVVSNSPAD